MEVLSFGDAGYGDEMLIGASVTVQLAIYSFVISLILGQVLGFVALSHNRVLQRIWRAYASIMMGVPSILVVFLLYYNAPLMFRAVLGTRVEVSPFVAGVTALGIVYAVYVGEVLRGAVINIPPGQFEAARSIGLRTLPMWWLVVLPQAWRLALPGVTNVWMVVLKDTALISLVGLTDIVRIADVAAAVTKEPFLFYLVAGFAYIIFSSVTMVGAERFERWVNRGQKYSEGS
jgi:polar amino acid transport system permease protein